MAIRTTLLLSDLQYPYHDPTALKKFIQVAKDTQPDAILSIGDLIDFPQVSRWSKGTAGEYAPTLQEHIDGLRSEVLEELRNACPNSEMTWLIGNHDLRAEEFIKQYAAPLTTLRALSMQNLFGLEELGVKYVKGPIRIATNTYAVHGHESSGYAGTPQAWENKFVKRYGSNRSIVFGHTHQGHLLTRAYGFDGNVTPRFQMNLGSLMDPKHARYIKDGSVSWQMSFGFLRDDDKRVWPELITMVDKTFFFNGKRY